MSRWVAMHCTDETEALQERYPNAFLLLCQIARRARWKDCSITGLRTGEAWIGDWKKAGIRTKKAYEVAKARLEKCGLVEFQGGNRGTCARLADSRVFSILQEQRGNQEAAPTGSEGAALDKQRGTIHTEHPEYTEKTDSPKRQERVTYSASPENGRCPLSSDAASFDRISEEDAPRVALELQTAEDPSSDLRLIPSSRVEQWGIDWYIKAEQSGWTMNGKPIKDARLALRGYLRKAAAGYVNSFKEMREAKPRLEYLPPDDEEEPF